jgi:gamma-glutamylcysteine synthetase
LKASTNINKKEERFLKIFVFIIFFELKDSISQETETTTEEINKIIDDQKSHMTRMQDEIKNKIGFFSKIIIIPKISLICFEKLRPKYE